MTSSSLFSRCSTALVACLALTLSACGGGGDNPSPTPTSPPGSNNNGSAAQALQAQLSACPTTLTLNEKMSCMVGLYEGKTTDTGADCSFNYGSDGVAHYTTGSQTIRADLSLLYSGAVFEKKAASNAAGFSITWSVGLASGHDMNLSYQASAEPASASGLLIKPKDAGVPACLVTAGPKAATAGSASMPNLLGHSWQAPQRINGSNGAVSVLADRPAFDAGLADDGHAFVVVRQPDSTGRLAVQVIEGQPGAVGQSPSWSAPQVLDADAPLIATSDFRPRIAVSANGHAVVMWATQRPCEADGYYLVNTGKTCRYVYASRRLVSAAGWEPAVRVAAAPLAVNDYYARINSQGNSVLVFNGAIVPSSHDYDPAGIDDRVVIARRQAAEAGWRLDRSEWILRKSSLRTLAEWAHVELDEASNVVIVAETNSSFGAVIHTRTDMVQPIPENAGLTHDAYGVYQSSWSGGGFAAYTFKSVTGIYDPAQPGKAMVYSPITQQWADTDLAPYTLGQDSLLIGTDSAAGEFLLYSGCKLTVWRAGTRGSTRNLTADCGGDQPGGVYAFNRKGDYLGINWAGRPGQWGYYSYAQDKLLKGSPGSGATVSGDFVLGMPADVFGAEPTQLLLAPNGLALAITTNTFTTLPAAAAPAGVQDASSQKLWAVYLK